MSLEEIQAELLKLGVEARARLARVLLESLEHATEAENLQLWVSEAERRARHWDESGDMGRADEDVFRSLLARLGS